MSKYTITPWRHQSDLLAVRAQLYRLNTTGPNPDQRRHAVDRVMAWKLRGNLPHAVESTALLIDATLHHHQSSPANSSFSIRAVYSAAFTRFVTGFCDMGRARERMLEPSSMLEIARQIGMPAEFVALRHEATHGELPALKRLVQASEEALAWLWRVYWSRLHEGEALATMQVGVGKDEARKALRTFRSSRREVLRAGTQGSVQNAQVAQSASMACVDLCGGGRQSAEALAELLVADRLMLPSPRRLGSSIEGAFLIWRDLLSELSATSRHFLRALVDRFMEALVDLSDIDVEHDVEKEAQMLWILALTLDDVASAGAAKTSSLRNLVMKLCCLYPGYWTSKLGQDLLDSDENLVDEWRDLLEASGLRDGDDINVKAPHDVQMLDSQAGSGAFVPDAEPSLRGWHRATLPPCVPIGMV